MRMLSVSAGEDGFGSRSRSRRVQEYSWLQKAFYRNKGCQDPYNNIEDKVGLPFVVLLANDRRCYEF
jgi:hypothetical protein